MRLWSLHPRYLDRQGLLALWREALLARAVMRSDTRGRTRHPQLLRFQAHPQPRPAMNAWLAAVHEEACRRGHAFDRTKIGPLRAVRPMAVNRGQLACEWEHLQGKLFARSPTVHERWRDAVAPACPSAVPPERRPRRSVGTAVHAMKRSRIPRLLVGLALLLVCVAALARPALWVVKDADTTIYLFGTVHVLPNDTAWRSPALEQALAQSRALYIEITDDDSAHMIALVLKYGMDPTHPLADQLDPTQRQQLQRAAEHAGVPGGMQTLNVMRPWLAALTLTAAPLLKAGLDPQHGVDKQLKAQMLAAGKPVLGLETAEQQIRLLADMPEPMQLAFLRSALNDIDKGPAELHALIDAWKAGDTRRIARIEDEDLRQQSPALYQRLLVQRNQAWATQIAALVQRPGTLFIAVGAAHLAGPDSVQVQLHKLGVEAVRQ